MKNWIILVASLVAGMTFARGQQMPQWRATSFRGMTVVTPFIWQMGSKNGTYFGAGEVPEQAYDLSVITSYRVTDSADAADSASRPLFGMVTIMLGDTTTLTPEPCFAIAGSDSVNHRIEGKEFAGIFADLGSTVVKFRYRVYRYEPLQRQWEVFVMYLDQEEERMVADRIFDSITFGEGACSEKEPIGNND
ncbi:MAG: hypothetical protein LIO68_06530 [Rikenellaceae bacterium]|nr:hypothetical protein [Rikenellaceae bacterium]